VDWWQFTAGGGGPTPTPTPTPTASGNLITNGTMESGTSGWSVFGAGTLSANTSVVHGGTQSLSITGRTASWNGPSQSMTSKLTNGKSYATSVWVRSQSGTPSAKVTLAVTANGTTSYLSLTPATAVNSSGWTQLSGTATVSWTGTLTGATLLRRDQRRHRRPLPRRRFIPIVRAGEIGLGLTVGTGGVRPHRRLASLDGGCDRRVIRSVAGRGHRFPKPYVEPGGGTMRRQRRNLRWLLAVAVGVLVSYALVGLQPSGAQALENGVARTPPMGWNTWNSFGCNINETLIPQARTAIVSSGMRDAGYQYVVVDDCWFNPNRDSAGNLQGDPSRFPSGMKALGDYLHARGLKFGIYEVPVDQTCAQYFDSYPGSTGSQGHETADARQFAAWGVDYLKYDWCSPNGTINDQVTTFARMRDALAATGRPIRVQHQPNSIHAKTGPQRNWGDVANMWRTTEDIQLTWVTNQTNGYPMGIQNIINVNVPLAGYAAPGRSTTRT
jgi:hypothetical protein